MKFLKIAALGCVISLLYRIYTLTANHGSNKMVEIAFYAFLFVLITTLYLLYNRIPNSSYGLGYPGGLYHRDKYLYENAIRKDQTIEFLLGRGDYLYADRESAGLHTPYITFADIEEYGRIYGQAKMLKHFKADIKKVLQLDLDPNDFLTVSTYIWIYMLDFYEQKSLSIEWIPDEEIKMLIKKHYDDFVSRFDPTEEFNNQFPKQSNGFFVRNIMAKYRQIKERFGVDLLD